MSAMTTYQLPYSTTLGVVKKHVFFFKRNKKKQIKRLKQKKHDVKKPFISK